jgi:hypothetical protein
VIILSLVPAGIARLEGESVERNKHGGAGLASRHLPRPAPRTVDARARLHGLAFALIDGYNFWAFGIKRLQRQTLGPGHLGRGFLLGVSRQPLLFAMIDWRTGPKAMRRKKSKETYLAVLIRAADAHSNWEVIADENGIPFAVRKKDKTAPGPDSPKELAEWFVETFPEEAVDILSGEIH